MNYLEMYQLFMYLQFNFNKDMCDKVFGDLSDHLFQKWLRCDNNMLNYMSTLDDGNKIKLIDWGVKRNSLNI